MAPFIILASALMLATMAALAVVVLRRQREALAATVPSGGLKPDAHGIMVVPIQRAVIYGGSGFLSGKARNSLNPKLALTREGMVFKVLREGRWAYGEIARVHAGRSLFGPVVEFAGPRARLAVTCLDLAMARQVLAALPRGVPLSPKAKGLRDDGVL